MTEPPRGPRPAIPDDAREGLDALLRRCIQCGLCLPVCATWLATGDETMSPRGRLLLWGEVLADPAAAAADSGWHEALDSCLGCLACTAVCPSGVPAALLATAVATARWLPAVAMFLWLAHLWRWRAQAVAMDTAAHERAMYRALFLWALVDGMLVAAWLLPLR